MKILLILFFITFALCNYVCPKYECINKDFDINQICMNRTHEKVIIGTCKDYQIQESKKKMFCYKEPTFIEHSYCTLHNFVPYLFPGEYCERVHQDDPITNKSREYTGCNKGNCDKWNLCNAHEINDSCSSDADCNEELYCNSHNICKETIKNGKKCSMNEHDIEKCESNSFCYEGFCRRYGEFKIGIGATVPAVCETFYIHEKKCAVGPKLQGGYECPESRKCLYKIGEKTFTEPCICGENDEGRKYCQPGKGDINIKPVFLFD